MGVLRRRVLLAIFAMSLAASAVFGWLAVAFLLSGPGDGAGPESTSPSEGSDAFFQNPSTVDGTETDNGVAVMVFLTLGGVSGSLVAVSGLFIGREVRKEKRKMVRQKAGKELLDDLKDFERSRQGPGMRNT